ncbi:MAG: hypothetical protein K0R61_1815, partial [Microvirga sp.]|nr:hypothetical protein [Microvirga sp.]
MGLSGTQRPENVQARSLSPDSGVEFRVMARIPGLQEPPTRPRPGLSVRGARARQTLHVLAPDLESFLPLPHEFVPLIHCSDPGNRPGLVVGSYR